MSATPSPFRTAIYGKLNGDATLTALLSSATAIHHRKAPQDADPPYIVFFKSSGARRWTYEDYTTWDMWTIKGVCRGDDAAEAEAIDARCEAILNDAALTIVGHRQLHLRRNTDVDFGETDAGGGEWHNAGGVYRLVSQPTS